MADIKELTALVIGSYVEHNAVSAADLPGLIRATYAALTGAGEPPTPVEEPSSRVTAGAIRKSLADPEFITSFIDGQQYRSLKRHVTTHGMTLAEYRAKFGLPDDYPSVSVASSAKRSEIAKQMGLGQRRVPEPVAPVKAARKPRAPKAAVAAIAALAPALAAKEAKAKVRPAGAIDPADETFS
jgi:predicted transcriptional regulator